jgi:hypothetical protein
MIPPAFLRLTRGVQASRLAVSVTLHMDGVEVTATPAGRPIMAIPSEDREFATTVGGRQVITSAPVRTLAREDLPRDPQRGDRITDADGTHTVSQVVRAPLGKWDCLLGKA